MMDLRLVRVDDRFIHGQILEAWIPYLGADGVVIINDRLSSDEFQKSIMEMALPGRIAFKVSSVDDAPKLKDNALFKDKKVLIIVSSLMDAFNIYNRGITFNRLNIGNLKVHNGSYQLSFSVWVDNKDIKIIKSLMAEGVYVAVQSVPREREINVGDILEMIKL